jgi:DNA modification methylase
MARKDGREKDQIGKEKKDGIYNPKNKLNELTGRQWIKFTKSWFVHNPPKRKRDEILHPAKFPESMIQDFIEFFTKKGEWVLDPFLGTGSTLVASIQADRSVIGVEIMRKYANIAEKRAEDAFKTLKSEPNKEKKNSSPNFKVIVDDSLNLGEIWIKNDLPKIDYCITSPPYWSQLKRNDYRQSKRKGSGLDTKYGEKERDIGNIDDYQVFVREQQKIFDEVYKIMKNKAYLTVITNNVYTDGRLFPLAFDTMKSLSKTWVPKDEKIWLQNDKALLPLGVNSAWVGNRHHQYCLIFRKEQ